MLVASFTRAAAVELASRIDVETNRSQIGTLHALCYRMLGSPPIAETQIKAFNAAQRVYQLTGEGIDIDEPEQNFDSESDRIFADYQVQRARLTPREQWPREVAAFAHSWEGWKTDTGVIDFTDMIEEALFSAHVPEAVRIGFFDEVQDFTPLELLLVRQWGDGMENIVLAGDDDQCIYGFKGASPDAFLLPPVPDAQKRVLGQSYRMPAAVQRVTQAWIEQVKHRESKPFAARASEGAVETRPDLFYKAPDTLVDEAMAKARDGHEVMLLAACSYQMQPIVKTLRARGALFHNPYRRKRGDWNPLRPARGLSASQRLLALLRFDDRVWGSEARPWTYGDLHDWMPLVRKTGVFRRGSWTKIVEGQPSERPVSSAVMFQLFEDGVVDAIRNAPYEWVADHVASERAQGLAYPLTVARLHGADALVDARPNIVVGTIHSVKGAQAHEVYVFPDLSRAGYCEWTDDRTRDNTVRQFYVGMSRAIETLHLCGQSTPEAIQWQRGQ